MILDALPFVPAITAHESQELLVAAQADPPADMTVDHIMISVSDFERSARW